MGDSENNHLDGNFLYPKYGFGAIFTSIEKMLNKDQILLNSPIKKLFHNGQRVNKILLEDAREVNVDSVVSTLPLPLLINQLNPGAPENIKNIVN